jgi:chitinase
MNRKLLLYTTLLTLLIGFNFKAFSQIPKPALVGYWQNWSSDLKLTEVHDAYNVIQIAFGITEGSSISKISFSLPWNYSKSAFMTDINILHSKGKVVLLSIGGGNHPVRLDNEEAKQEFISSVNTILQEYHYKFDGIDIDFESSSMAFGSSWTMDDPAPAQINLIDAIKTLMSDYKNATGKKMLLTMAPETIYLMGAMSSYQMDTYNGGAMLPIIENLKDEIDLLHCQYYNAGGATGGTYAIDGVIYFDNSDPDYITSMTESIIKGFPLLRNKGVYSGFPSSKVAIGLPAIPSSCLGTGSGYNSPEDVCRAVQYLQGKISKPSDFSYTVTASYPDLAGLMTWSINHDKNTCGGVYSFAENFACAFGVINNLPIAMDEIRGIEVYPNPANDYINLNIEADLTGATEFDIVNAEGEIIYKGSLLSEMKTYNLDIHDFKSGLYFIRIHSDKVKWNKRFVKY